MNDEKQALIRAFHASRDPKARGQISLWLQEYEHRPHDSQLDPGDRDPRNPVGNRTGNLWIQET